VDREALRRLDEELQNLLASSSDIKTLLCKLADHILRLLSTLYGEDSVRKFMYDVSRSREYILAIYLCIALSVYDRCIDLSSLPEDVARELISRLLILYEKCKHIREIVERSDLGGR